MVVVPVQINAQEFNIFIVLEKDNIRRIRRYDPAEVSIPKLPANWSALRVSTIFVGYASKEEIADLQACNDKAAVEAQLKRLSRGFRFRPNLGDNDLPYKRGRG